MNAPILSTFAILALAGCLSSEQGADEPRRRAQQGDSGGIAYEMDDGATGDGGTSDGGTTDGGTTDGGGTSDGGTTDGGTTDGGGDSDGGTSDGGTTDGGTTDGGITDGGTTSDGGTTDGGTTSDGGTTDGGTASDGGTSDGGTSDGGDSDGGEDTTPDPAAGNRGVLVITSWDRVDAAYGEGAGSYRTIIMPLSLYTALDDVRAANPDADILAYQKVGGMRDDGGDYASTGVLISEAEDAAGEDWFLHDEDGERLYYCDYTSVAVADIGNADYQARWLDNVQTRLARDGWDGVFMDDTNIFPGHCLGSLGTPMAEYAEDEDYGDAVVSFMAAVGPELMADGYVVAPNLALNPWTDWMVETALEVAANTTHVFREYWMRWDDSEVFTGDMWLSTLTFFEDVEELGVGFMAITYGPGDEGVTWGQRYGRASFLLAWDGEQESGWGYLDEEVDPWSDEWDGDIGLPTEDRTAVGVGWRRSYSGGMVLVNADSSDSQDFDLDATYVDADGEDVDEVTLEPGEAAILTLAD